MIIWVASYPRSGNTFFRTVLHQAFGLDTWSVYPEGEDGAGSVPDITGHRQFTRDFRLEDAATSDEVFFVKTHELPADGRKAVYLLRDGRATIASYYHYARNIRGDQLSIADAIIGKIMFGNWSTHVMSWNPLHRPDTLFLKFEDVVGDVGRFLPQIAAFIGRDPRAEATVAAFSELQARDPKFFRSGKTDGWRSDFSSEDHDLFWALHGQTMARYGYCVPGAEGERAARGSWRLAGDAERNAVEIARLREQLDRLTNPDDAVDSIPLLLERAAAAVRDVEMRGIEQTAAVQRLVLRLSDLVNRSAA